MKKIKKIKNNLLIVSLLSSALSQNAFSLNEGTFNRSKIPEFSLYYGVEFLIENPVLRLIAGLKVYDKDTSFDLNKTDSSFKKSGFGIKISSDANYGISFDMNKFSPVSPLNYFEGRDLKNLEGEVGVGYSFLKSEFFLRSGTNYYGKTSGSVSSGLRFSLEDRFNLYLGYNVNIDPTTKKKDANNLTN